MKVGRMIVNTEYGQKKYLEVLPQFGQIEFYVGQPAIIELRV